MFNIGGCKILAVTSLASNQEYYSRWVESGYSFTAYLWNGGAFCIVRSPEHGRVDMLDEDDSLELCNQYGMPDAWISSN